MGKQHVVLVPTPAQGHVTPLLELAQWLVDTNCFIVTFVNTEAIHKRLISSIQEGDDVRNRINFVVFPDSTEPWQDGMDFKRYSEGIARAMTPKLEELIEEINGRDEGNVACVIADLNMPCALEVAKKKQIKGAAFWTAAAAILALALRIPKMIEEGIIDNDGTPIKSEMTELSPAFPAAMNTSIVPWIQIQGNIPQKFFFDICVKYITDVEIANLVICNSSYVLEPEVFTAFPNMIPIGPLLASNRFANPAGSLWPEDSSCLHWLDQQADNSVIYVSFGSVADLNKTQFHELALGLELSNRPFLWVVRPDIAHHLRSSDDDDDDSAYPVGFKERVGSRGKIVDWAPQQKVLSHPSVGCFISHCGWNSTIEGISTGIPFLCWPYYYDQFLNQTYICDIWKVGLPLNHEGSGIVGREEIKDKVQRVLGDMTFKAMAMNLKEEVEKSVKTGGKSHKSFNDIIEWMKA